MSSLIKTETQKYSHYEIILVKQKYIINQEFNYCKRHLDVYFNIQI